MCCSQLRWQESYDLIDEHGAWYSPSWLLAHMLRLMQGCLLSWVTPVASVQLMNWLEKDLNHQRMWWCMILIDVVIQNDEQHWSASVSRVMLYKQELIQELETVQCAVYYSRSDCLTVGSLHRSDGSIQLDSNDGLLEVVIYMLPPRWLSDSWMETSWCSIALHGNWGEMETREWMVNGTTHCLSFC